MRDPEKAQPEGGSQSRNWRVAGLTLLWIATSCAITLHNKHILSTLEFGYPYLLTCWHLAFTTCVTRVFTVFAPVPDGRISWKPWARGMLPLACLSSASLILGNKAYLYLSVSSIQLLKATSPAAASIAAYLFALSIPTVRDVVRTIAIILAGVMVSYGDLKLTNIGLAVQLGAITANALRATLSQVLLQSSAMRPSSFLYHSAPVGVFIGAGCAIFFELPQFQVQDLQKIGLFQAIVNASLALSVTITTSYLIEGSSAFTLSMSSILRDVILVCGSCVAFGTALGTWQVAGYSLIVMCLLEYSVAPRQAAPRKSPSDG